MTADERNALLAEYRTAELPRQREIEDVLIRAHRRYLYKQVIRLGVELKDRDEMVQPAAIGLLHTIRTYDPTRGPFYAAAGMHIMNQVRLAQHANQPGAYVPRNVNNEMWKATKDGTPQSNLGLLAQKAWQVTSFDIVRSDGAAAVKHPTVDDTASIEAVEASMIIDHAVSALIRCGVPADKIVIFNRYLHGGTTLTSTEWEYGRAVQELVGMAVRGTIGTVKYTPRHGWARAAAACLLGVPSTSIKRSSANLDTTAPPAFVAA